ncbi:MAG: hypothetical protein ACRCZI_04645 [Cetobacterium sp.]
MIEIISMMTVLIMIIIIIYIQPINLPAETQPINLPAETQPINLPAETQPINLPAETPHTPVINYAECLSNENSGLCKNNEITDEKYRFILQSDGNIVIYRKSDNTPLWTSNTSNVGTAPYKLIMQSDGNLLAYDKYDTVIWASDSHHFGEAPYKSILTTDGKVMIIDSTNKNRIATTTPIDCVMSDWTACDTNTMTRTRKIMLQPNRSGKKCGNLTDRCDLYTRTGYSPSCDNGLLQKGNNCYKIPTVNQSQIDDTTYIKDCPSGSILDGSSCVYSIPAYRPTNCPSGSELSMTAAGQNTGNCIIKSYSRPVFYNTTVWGNNAITNCENETKSSCEMINSGAYPKFKEGYIYSSMFPDKCEPEGGSYGTKQIGVVECNVGDIRYNLDCYPRPLPGFIADQEPTYYTNGVTNRLTYRAEAERLNFEDAGLAKCKAGDIYSIKTQRCYPPPLSGFTCDDDRCIAS